MAIAVLTCPQCGGTQELTIPGDQCLPLYRCEACQVLIPAAPGDCCVICSYSTARCPVSTKA